MTSDPVILVLDDERAQLLTLRAQLAGLGRLAEFTDAERALEFARSQRCDAAIVDIGLPRSTMDGLEFLRALREFDKELAIIIRTGSESDQIADGAIEMRAIKRAVKSKTSGADLRQSAQEAIRETRERRETAANARDTTATKVQLAEALGAYDLQSAAADLNRGLVHTLRNRLTALSALAAVLREDAADGGVPEFAEHTRRSAELVADMVDSVNAFLDGPFGESGATARAAVNECLGALRQFFRGAERWAAEGKRLAIRDLMSDTLVACAPLQLLNGLRHLAEYFLLQAPRGAEVSLTAGIAHSAEAMPTLFDRSACVLNREAIRRTRPYVSICATGPLPGSLETLRDAFSFGPQSGRTGNLNVLARVLTAAEGAALLQPGAAGVFTVEAVFPVAM